MEPLKIIRWDIVKDSCDDFIKPMIYFKPTLKTLQFLRDNDYNVRIRIKGAGAYDGCHFGVVDKSSNVPNCRPNFFDATQFYIITLDTTFKSFPQALDKGSFVFDTSPVTTPSVEREIKESLSGDKRGNGGGRKHGGENGNGNGNGNGGGKKNGGNKKSKDDLNLTQILLIVGAILLLLIIIIGSIFCFKDNEKHRTKKYHRR